MSWLWVVPPAVFGAGAIAVVLVLRSTAAAAHDLAASARELGHLRSNLASLRSDLASFTAAATDVGRGSSATGRPVA